ncbi:MAG: hypothetical protein AAF253_02770 [Pseudomonadota bacterium]
MITDSLFFRHKDAVWPFFWPVFLVAIAWFNRRAQALIADGCASIDYVVSPYGLISITKTIRTGGPRCWKDQLYAATGAYGDGDTDLFGGYSQASRRAQGQTQDQAQTELAPQELCALLACCLNIVFLPRAVRRSGQAPAATALIGLPLPHT